LAYFGRPADVSGLSFYADKTEAQVVAAFSASAESQAFFGSLNTLAQINTIYQNLFNRAAEPAGLTYWAGEINSGRLSLAQASMGILAGAQNADRLAVTNKLAAATAFTAALDTSAEMIGYQGTSVITSARAFLASVNDTAASLTAATATTALNASVATVVAAGASSASSSSGFTLTTGIDTPTTTTSTVITGAVNATVAASTFNTGDTISGARSVTITYANAGAEVVAANLTDVTTFSGTMLAAAQVNAALFSNVSNIQSLGGGLGFALTVNNGLLASTYGVSGETSAGGITLASTRTVVTGTADVINFAVTGSGTSTADVALVNSVATGVETATVATSGTNFFAISGVGFTAAATDGTTLNITGSGNNTINAAAMTNVSTYDMSTATGTNTLRLNGALTTSDVVKGGTGADTLRVAQVGTAAALTVTGVETLRMATGSVTGTLNFATAPSFTALRVDGDTAESGTNTLTGIGSTATALSYRGDELTANAATAQQFNNLTITGSYTGTADSLAVTVSNGGITQTAAGGYTLRTLTAAGVETMTVAVNDIAAGATATFTGITDTTLSSLSATSAGNVVFGTITTAGGAGDTGTLSTLNLSGITGTGTSSLTLANGVVATNLTITATGGTGTTTVTTGAEAAGDNIIYTGGAGIDNFTGTGFLGTITATGGASADVMLGGSGIDTITGGEGADRITGSLGADVIILTETTSAADVVIFSAITDGSAAGTLTTGSDTITGFLGGTDKISVLGNAASVVINAIGTAQIALAAFTSTASGALDLNTLATGGAFITGATAADLTSSANVIAAIGAAANETVGESVYIAVQNTAANAYGVYHFVSTIASNTVAAAELKLLGIVSYTGTVVAGDFIFT